MNAVYHQNLRYSNFFITISTNVVPNNDGERKALADWLADRAEDLFHQWHVLNGTVLKPAGSDNRDGYGFPDPVQIISVRSMFSLEEGKTAQRGQVHMHVLMEVAHTYTDQVEGNFGTSGDDKPVVGVHVNVYQIRERLNAAIHLMDIEPYRRPPKIYVNSKLQTTGTDNSNKWLTVQYIHKDVAKPDDYTDGQQRDLRADEAEATEEDRAAAAGLRQRGVHTVIPDGASPPQRRPDYADEGVGGALTPPGSPPGSPFAPQAPHRAPVVQRPPLPGNGPSFAYTTSTANIGMPRNTRSRLPGRFRQ
jgi:hypothetical protein